MARAELHLSRSAIVHNFRLLSKKVPDSKLLPMVKANAYGHGALFAANALISEKKLYGFGVATFKEGIELRLALKNSRVPILVFSDSAPWSENHSRLCIQYALEPVLSEIVSLLSFQSSKLRREITAHVELNTGMNRLGIPVDSLPLVHFTPKSIFTHLANAETPKSSLTKLQMKTFEEAIVYIRQKFPKTLLHFANSSAIWRARDYRLSSQMDLVRPGLSLYGIRPYEKTSDQGLKRVMTFTAPILNRIYLQKGDSVGYGGTYTCKKTSGEWVAILGAGYADGVFRSLSGVGIATYKNKKFNFLGRVSMDLSAIQANESMQVGERVQLWGPDVDPYLQAKCAGTIPYELTTRIGERVERNNES